MPRFTGVVVRLAASCALLLTAATFNTSQSASAAQNTEVVIALDELGGSGVSGFATLVGGDGDTTVIIEVSDTVGDRPAHIYQGACGALGATPLYALQNVDDSGYSETTIAIDLDTLLTGSYALNLHASSSDLATNIACGDIVGSVETTSTTSEIDIILSEFNDSGYSGTATLLDESGGTTVLLVSDIALGDETVGIYGGICTDLDLDPTYDLGILDSSGVLEVGAPVALDTLLAGEFSLAVTDPFSGSILACAEIVSDTSGSTAGPSTGAGMASPTYGPPALAALAIAGVALAGCAWTMRRVSASH